MTQTLTNSRTSDLDRAILLGWISLAWMVVEATTSLALGHASCSLLLDGFGLDSILELVSAAVLLWRLAAERHGSLNESELDGVERRAAHVVGYTLYVLAVSLVLACAYDLMMHKTVNVQESVWGILIGLVAKVGMPILARLKLRLADRLQSRALRADAVEAIACGTLAVILMLGLAVTRAFPKLWWLDGVATLALIPVLVREGREAITGDCLCGCKPG